MAHMTLAGRDANADIRVISLRKNHLPGQPFRVSALNSNPNNKSYRCRQCGQIGEDACYCYAHNTFISRGDASVNIQNINMGQTLPKVLPIESGTQKGTGKKISFDAYKRLKNATNTADSMSPVSLSREPHDMSNLTLQTNKPSDDQRSTPREDFTNDRPSKKVKLSPPDIQAPESKKPYQSPKVSLDFVSTKSPVVKQFPRVSELHVTQLEKSNRTKAPVNNIKDKLTASLRSPTYRSNTPASTLTKTKPKTILARSPTHTNTTNLKEHRRSYSSQTEQSNPDIRTTTKPVNNGIGKIAVRKEVVSPRVLPDDTRSKDIKRVLEDILPPCLSPLPESLYKAVDEWERKLASRGTKQNEMDSLDETVPNNSKKSTKNSASEEKIGRKRNLGSGPGAVEAPRKTENGTHKFVSSIDSSSTTKRAIEDTKFSAPKTNGITNRTAYIAQKGPLKRPPHGSKGIAQKTKASSSKMIVKLAYGTKNTKKIARVLKTQVERSNCEQCVGLDQEGDSSDLEDGDEESHLAKSPGPDTTFKSPAVKPSSSKVHVITPAQKVGSKETVGMTPGSRPSTAFSSSNTVSDKNTNETSEIETLEADMRNFKSLGIKLKHETDRALGLKSSDGVDLVKGAVYAVHCIISYLLAFGLEDEIRKREKKSQISDNWKQVAHYIEFLLTSRLKATLPLHGLLYQLGAICNERVFAYEQQRLMSVPLSDESSPVDSTVIESIRKVRLDLNRSIRTGRDWWLLGHQRLPYTTVEDDFVLAWSKKSNSIVRKPQIFPGYYLMPYYLPLFSGSAPLEAASFAWLVAEEWAEKVGFYVDTGLVLKEKPDKRD